MYNFLRNLIEPQGVETAPKLSWEELCLVLKENLSAHDYQVFELLRAQFDIQTLASYFKGAPAGLSEVFGNFRLEESKEYLEELYLPPYLQDYLDQYPTESERSLNIAKLWQSFFHEMRMKEGFIGRYYAKERQLRMVLMALRAKLNHSDVAVALKGEPEDDFLVQHILRQRENKSYDPPDEFAQLKELLEGYKNPMELEKALISWRLSYLDLITEEFAARGLFTLESVLLIVAQQMWSSMWHLLDKSQGEQLIKPLKSPVLNEA